MDIQQIESKLWAAADKLRGNISSSDYKYVVLGLIFLKYISDAFELQYQKAESENFDPEDRDFYIQDNVFWVPKEARWDYLVANAKLQADAQTGLFGDIESSVNALDLLQEYKKTNAEFVSRLNAVKKATKELSPDSAAYKEMAGVQADLQAKLDDIVNQIRIRHNAKIAEDNLLRIATQELGAFEGKNWLKNYRENAEKMHTKPKKIKAGDKVIDERGQTRIVQQKNINDMQALLDKASSMNNPFHKKMERVSKELGYEYQRGPIKGIDRATEKLVADYGGDTRQMKDVLRGTIVIDNPNDIGRVVEAMRKNFKVVDEYSKFDQINATYVGYKDSKIITIHNGVYRETLVATPEMLKAKYELQGHVLYEQYRVKMNDWERTGKVMNRLYSEAEELTVRRIESSRGTSDSSIGEPSTTARMGENGALMNKLSATTSPSSTNTLMGSPSTSKNAGNVVGNFDRISSPFSESIAKNTSVVKTKESRVFERLKLEYPEIRGEHTYNTTTLKNEAIKADNLLAKDVHEAYRVAMNAADVSEVESVATNIAMTERALKEGNNSLASRLILNRSLAQTRRGQAIVMEKASIQNNQTSKFVKELIQRRMDTVKTTPLAESNLRLPGKKKKPSVTDIIDIEAKKIEKQVK